MSPAAAPRAQLILAARSPSGGPKQTQPESTEANTGQRLQVLQKRPWGSLISTRGPCAFKTNSRSAQIFARTPLGFLEIEPAVHP